MVSLEMKFMDPSDVDSLSTKSDRLMHKSAQRMYATGYSETANDSRPGRRAQC